MEPGLYAYAHEHARAAESRTVVRVALRKPCAMLGQHMAPILVPAPLFAHQFGWDEILMFVVPIVLALIGVRVAESRAATRQAARQSVDDQEPSEPTGPDDDAETAGDDSA